MKPDLTIREQFERLAWAAELDDRARSKSAQCQEGRKTPAPEAAEGSRAA